MAKTYHSKARGTRRQPSQAITSMRRLEQREHEQDMRAATLQPLAVNLLKERI
jgi:hypothetical protein